MEQDFMIKIVSFTVEVVSYAASGLKENVKVTGLDDPNLWIGKDIGA